MVRGRNQPKSTGHDSGGFHKVVAIRRNADMRSRLRRFEKLVSLSMRSTKSFKVKGTGCLFIRFSVWPNVACAGHTLPPIDNS